MKYLYIFGRVHHARDIKSHHWNEHLSCVNPDDRFRQEVWPKRKPRTASADVAL